MPRLDRPNTDQQRLQALANAVAKSDAVAAAGGTLAFSAATLARVSAFFPTFVAELQERGVALSQQSEATTSANPARASLRMYVSHFIRVFNMGVARGKYPAAHRAYYQLAVSSESVPSLTTDIDLIQWGENIVNGDAQRVAAGGAAMENPTAAEVGTELAALDALVGTLTTAKDNYDAEQEDVAALRAEADDIISDIWDEVLFTFRKDEASSQRRKAREYGVVYRYNTGETPSPSEYSVQGTVTDVDGNPLADVEITEAVTGKTAITDASGEYLFPILEPSNYTLTFSRTDFPPQSVPVTVVADEIVTVDVVMTV